MTLPLTAHQRIALQRRFPGASVEKRSVSCFRVIVDDCFVHVYRPPFAGRMICLPSAADTIRLPPPEHHVWAIRALLLEWIEGSIPDR